MADPRQKPGIWTEHVDAATGRTFYYNMVQNRSFWELPPELLAQVKKPALDVLREWDPEAAARYEQPASAEELERQRKKREEVLQAAALAAASQAADAGASSVAVHERMAIAAAQKRAEEMKRVAMEQKGKDDSASAATAQGNEYLSMVRELQAKDRDTESSGGKWLVR